MAGCDGVHENSGRHWKEASECLTRLAYLSMPTPLRPAGRLSSSFSILLSGQRQ